MPAVSLHSNVFALEMLNYQGIWTMNTSLEEAEETKPINLCGRINCSALYSSAQL